MEMAASCDHCGREVLLKMPCPSRIECPHCKKNFSLELEKRPFVDGPQLMRLVSLVVGWVTFKGVAGAIGWLPGIVAAAVVTGACIIIIEVTRWAFGKTNS